MNLVWSKLLPLKCKICFWCGLIDSILTKDILNHRGTNVDPKCSMCNLSNETIPHLFFHCSNTLEVWSILLQPRRRVYKLVLTADSVEELLIAWPKGKGGHLGSKIWELLPYALMWVLWRARNDTIFRSKLSSVERICMEIKATLWYWLGAWPERKFYSFPDLVSCWFELLNGYLIRTGSSQADKGLRVLLECSLYSLCMLPVRDCQYSSK